MPTYQASVETSAGAETAWAIWTDVASWSGADHLESATIYGEFTPGTAIEVKAKGFPRNEVTLTRVEPPGLWADASRAPGVRMAFDHLIEPRGGGTLLTERVEISGPLGFIVGPLLRRRMEALFAASVADIAARAEVREAGSR